MRQNIFNREGRSVYPLSNQNIFNREGRSSTDYTFHKNNCRAKSSRAASVYPFLIGKGGANYHGVRGLYFLAVFFYGDYSLCSQK